MLRAYSLLSIGRLSDELLNKWWCLLLLTQRLSAKVNVEVPKHAMA